MGQVNSLPQCTVSYPNGRPRPSGQILWCGEAAPRREDAIRALRSDPLVRGSGRVVPSGAVIRRVRARCPAGAGRQDPIRRGRPDRGSWAPVWRSARTPADVRAHAPHRTRPAPPDRSGPETAKHPPSPHPPPMRAPGPRAPAGTPSGPGSSPTPHGSPPPSHRAPPGTADHRRPPPRTPHERITHSDVHFWPHPCYDRTRCNRIHY